ncbi:hypothetical protein DFH06DRAFT_1321079 [Mycena polygramma]|nr:hypothetical protein DFH06DRAFT_1321079 [Mycena polygramma]
MHPALRLDRLNRLPPSVRRAAQAACSATCSIDDIRRVQIYLETATEEQSLFMLPVFYINLNPATVPDLDHYDTENPSADAESCIGRALVSLLSLYAMKLPPGIGPDIWPRVWPWIQFLHIYREHLPNMPSQSEDVLCFDFLVFAGTFSDHVESFALILSTPGVCFLVAEAWPHVLQILDHRERELGLTELYSFIADTKITEPTNFAELINGAGGTLDHLADLIVRYIEAMLPAEGGKIDFMYIVFTFTILDFVLRIEPAFDDSDAVMGPLGPVGTALVSRNIVPALTSILCVLGGTTASLTPSALDKCFRILGSILIAKPVKIQRLSDALESQLLRALVICSGSPHAARVQKFLEFFLVTLIPPQLVHPVVLASLEIGLDDVDEPACGDTFKRSHIYNQWVQFCELAEDRISVLNMYKGGKMPSMRACDNLQVIAVKYKSSPLSGGAPAVLVYTTVPRPVNPSTGWKEGIGRLARLTGSYLFVASLIHFLTLLLSGGNNDFDLNTRDRSFLRALIHHDYQKRDSKITIFFQTTICVANQPDEGFLILYDYTKGELGLSIHPLSGAQTKQHLGGPEWTDIVSRAKRSRQRMGLHVLVFTGAHGLQYHAIPLRSNKSSVHESLQALADGLPTERGTWDEHADIFLEKIGHIISTHEEDAGLLEVH